jgi:hypothetical protein
VGAVIGALAYLGPGGALTALGSALALLAAIAIAFLGMIWYPIKRLLRWRRTRAARERAPH